VEIDAGHGALRGSVVKNVRERPANYAKSLFRTVNGQRRFLPNIERPNIVESQNVVGVAVGEEDGVEAIEADAEGLLAEIRSGVDDDVLAVAREKQGRAQAIIVGIGGGADAALARERGNAHGGTGAEDGEFDGSARHVPEEIVSKRAESWECAAGASGTEISDRAGRYFRLCELVLPRLGLSLLRGLGGNGLVDLEEGHFELAEQVEEERIFLGSEVALGFFVQSVEHIDEFAGRIGIEHGLTGARIGIGAQDHGGVAAEHADEIFESGRALRSVRGRNWRLGGFRRGSGVMLRGITAGFALLLFDNLLAEFTFRGEGAAIDDAKSLFWFVVSQ